MKDFVVYDETGKLSDFDLKTLKKAFKRVRRLIQQSGGTLEQVGEDLYIRGVGVKGEGGLSG